ncbi:MAG: oligosaccharide flippase family protein [Victivallaceae bacterium]|nr:oligosaccharide flippase family protein [Victivallaceae bacterium]
MENHYGLQDTVMSESHLKTFIRGSAVSIVGIGLLGIVNYLIRRYMALNMTEIEYGFFYSALSMVMLIMSFINMGLGQSSQILIARAHGAENAERASRYFSVFFYVTVAISVTVFVVVEAISPILATSFFKYPDGKVALAIIFMLLIALSLESVITNGLTAKKLFMARNTLLVVKSSLILSLLWIFGSKLIFSAIFYVACGIPIIICGIWLIWRKTSLRILSPKSLDGDDLRNLFSFSIWVAVSTAGVSAIYYFDTLCLTMLTGLEEVAIYNIALPLMQIVQGLMVFPVVFTPIAAEMWGKGDRHGILQIWKKVTLFMLLMLPFLIIVGIFGGEFIIAMMFSKKFITAAPVMTVLWVGMIFFSVARFNMAILNSAGRQKIVALTICGGCLCSIILNFVFIPFFGALGAAIANMLTYTFLAIITTVIFIRITVLQKAKENQ